MKLLHCLNCNDMFNLSAEHVKMCTCKQTIGKYISDNNIIYSGPAVVLGIGNGSFFEAIKNRPDYGECEDNMRGDVIHAFILAKHNRNAIKLDDPISIDLKWEGNAAKIAIKVEEKE
ncbi:MAG: hypothetical protein KAS32_20940 [Candidatus Peribacteraceae bacterium]|nr:hypothetical protein [Candidatus Peribacteraceae bacterium]